MGWDCQIEALLEKPCFVIDFLPRQVPADSPGRFFEVERYFLEGKEFKRTAKRFVRIILKLQCYYHLEMYCGKLMEHMEIRELAAYIEQSVLKKKGFIQFLFPEANVLLCLEGDSLNLTVYNPGPEIQKILSELAASEGMFFRQVRNTNVEWP